MRSWGILSLAIGIVGFGSMGSKSWKGWDRYQVIMWSTGAPKDLSVWFERLKEMGCTAEECYRGRDPTPFVQHRFGFYVENLVPELAYLHSRRRLYEEDFRSYTSTRDKRFLVRRPCLHDPDFWKGMKRHLQELVSPYIPYGPLLYNLQDELSIGSFASPMDYCFGPHTLREFRRWLQERYGSLEELNEEWGTKFASWDEVEPMTTYQIKERERETIAEGELENYAPWADHKEFMDLSFAQTLARLREFIRELDPNTPVGIEGTQMPSAWGGYDLWKLSQVIDWVEPYDIANSREIFRSFLPPDAPVVSTVFGSDVPRIKRRLWWLLLHGDRGCIIWDDERSRCIEKNKGDMPITERGKGLARIFEELKSIAPTIFKLQPVSDPIAIHYSQASIRAHWMFDSREDGDSWPRRLSSYEATHSRLARVRDSFVRIVEDLGLQFRFVSYEEIEKGELLKGGYKVLLLPQSVAMSREECRRIEEFVRAGGTVIADNMTATMDEHCKRLASGQLDELFGIKRDEVGWRPEAGGGPLPSDIPEAVPLKAYEPDITVTTGEALYFIGPTPAVIENRAGKGRAIYLNLDMHDYGKLRLTPPKGENYLHLFRRLLRESGIEPPVKALDATTGQPVPCVEIWRYRDEDSDYIALMRNPEFDADSLRDVGYPDNSELERSVRVQIILPRRARVMDVRTGKNLGTSDRVEMELDPWSPIILKLSSPSISD